MPHVHRSVLIHQALAAEDALDTTLTGLLDSSPIGSLHLDHGGRVLAANAPILAILRRNDGLCDKGGTLGA